MALHQARMPRVCGFRLSVCAAALLDACAPWAHGPRVSPVASGLVGEWVRSANPRSADTTVWRFVADGTAEQVRLRPSHNPKHVALGPFRVYADTGRTQLICFSQRGRSAPPCRYFQVDTLSVVAAPVRRRLQLLGWLGEKGRAPEILVERTP